MLTFCCYRLSYPRYASAVLAVGPCLCVCLNRYCICIDGCRDQLSQFWHNSFPPAVCFKEIRNKKHLKNVGPIRHCELPHAALPFTRCRYCRVARRLRIDVYNNNNDNA